MANEIDWFGQAPRPRARANVGRKKTAKTRRRTRAPDQTRDALLKAAVAEFAREEASEERIIEAATTGQQAPP